MRVDLCEALQVCLPVSRHRQQGEALCAQGLPKREAGWWLTGLTPRTVTWNPELTQLVSAQGDPCVVDGVPWHKLVAMLRPGLLSEPPPPAPGLGLVSLASGLRPAARTHLKSLPLKKSQAEVWHTTSRPISRLLQHRLVPELGGRWACFQEVKKLSVSLNILRGVQPQTDGALPKLGMVETDCVPP